MSDISNSEVVDFYSQGMGLTQYSFIKNGRIRNIYDILGIKPKVDDRGKRELTPYEILKVPPQMEMGKEIPIVFAIKNRVGKIGRYDGNEYVYTYQSKKVKTEATLLQTLKSNYKKAVFEGDEEQAYRILQMYDKVSGGKAKEFLESFFDYTKFYRRMKKQLLIDLFAHFFLMQMDQPKTKTLKMGALKKNRSIRPFRASPYAYSGGYNEEQIMETAQRAEINMVNNVNRKQKFIDPWTFTFFGRKKTKGRIPAISQRMHMRRYDWIAESLGFGNRKEKKSNVKKNENKVGEKLNNVNGDNGMNKLNNKEMPGKLPENQINKIGGNNISNVKNPKTFGPEIQRGLSFDG